MRVSIIHTNERGCYACKNGWDWAVVRPTNFGDDEWLDAFATKKEAIKFCKENGYDYRQRDEGGVR